MADFVLGLIAMMMISALAIGTLLLAFIAIAAIREVVVYRKTEKRWMEKNKKGDQL